MSFSAAFDRSLDDVYGYLAYRSGSRRLAEDLTAETFERARRSWGSFDAEPESVRNWLLAIARSVYIDSRRDGRSRGEVAGAAVAPAPEVARALRRLERREREVIALRFGADMRASAIAEVLGISTSNAQQLLARALRRLRAALDADPG